MSSTADNKVYCAISTIYGIAEIQKIRANHRSKAAGRAQEIVGRAIPSRPAGAAH